MTTNSDKSGDQFDGAVEYNKRRPYTCALWRVIQTKVGTASDGLPGKNTAQAIFDYQLGTDGQLAADGYCGPTTLAHLDEGLFKIIGDVLVFPKCKLAVDADGSPKAYNQPNTGIDHNANAGWPGDGWGLALDDDGRPYVQGPTDPTPNHYVSVTALVDGDYPEHDPRRYYDSRFYDYIAVPRNFQDLLPSGFKGWKGDYVGVERTEKTVRAIVADVSGTVVLEPNRHVNNVRQDNLRLFGEGSIALHYEMDNDCYRKKNGLWRASYGISTGIVMRVGKG